MSLETLPSAATASIGAIPLSAISTTGAITGDIMQFNGSAWGPTGTTLSITDNLMKLGLGNVTTDVTDLGIYFPYNSSGVKYGAMFRDATDGTFNVVDRLESEPTSTVTLGNTYAKFSSSDFKMYNYTDATKSATLSVDSSNNLSLTPASTGNILIPANKQLLMGTTLTTFGSITPIAYFRSDIASPSGIAINNVNFDNTTSDCKLIIRTSFTGGNPSVELQLATEGYTFGIDQYQSKRLQICYGNPPAIGTNVLLSSSTAGDWGMGLSATQASNARLELLKTTEQLRLTHTHNTKYVSFTVDTNENLTIDPTNAGAVIVNSALTASGALTASTTLGVTGATTLSSTLGVTGATTLSSTLGVTGATTLSSTLGVTGATTLSSTAQILRLGLGGAADGTAQLMITSGGDVKFTVANGDLTITPSGSDITLNTAKIGMTSSGTNTGIGYLALGASTGLSNNTAVGTSALASLDVASGAFNTAVGSSAGTAITTGTYNTIVGRNAALILTNGSSNVAIGASTLSQLGLGTGSSDNVAIGHGSLSGEEGVQHNVCIGKSSGNGLTTGGSNIVIGSLAGTLASTTGSNNILIGRGCNFDATTMANTIKIGFGTTPYTMCKIEGISGASITGTSSLVGVDSNGILGTVGASSILNTTSMLQVTKASEQLRLINNGAVDAKFTVDGSGVLTVAPSGSTAITGALAVSTTLGVTGATTLSSTLGVTGATTLSSTAQILRLGLGGAADATAQLKLTNTGNITFTCDTNGDLSIVPSGGDTAITGNTTISGGLTSKPAIKLLQNTIEGTASICGGNAAGLNTNAQIAFGYNGTDTFRHFISTIHTAAPTGNAIRFWVATNIGNSLASATHVLTIENGGIAVGISESDLRSTTANIHSMKTTEQLRLSYNATKYVSFTVDTSENLTIDPTNAGAVIVNSNLNVTGTTTLATSLNGIAKFTSGVVSGSAALTNLSDYTSQSSNVTFSGIWAADQTVPVYLTKIANKVTMSFKVEATANTMAPISFTVPSGYRPTNAIKVLCMSRDAGVYAISRINIASDGTSTIDASLGTANFTGAGTSGAECHVTFDARS